MPGFVARHFSLRGSLAIHRRAVGWDIVKAPLNLTLAGPQAAVRLAGLAARRAGAHRLGGALANRTLLLETAVAREIEWLVRTELLQLPYRQQAGKRTRESRHDALWEAILEAAPLQEAFAEIARASLREDFAPRLRQALTEYAGSRAAAAEITTGLVSLSVGAATLGKLAPGAASLGPALAALLTQQAAISSFPLGAALGSAWYAAFPVVAPAGLVAALTGGLMLAATTFSAFAGIIADPLQQRFGLHRRRLLRLIDALERQALDREAHGLTLRDPYVARLLDLFDLLTAALRLAKG